MMKLFSKYQPVSQHPLRHRVASCVALALAGVLTACSGSNSSPTTTPPPTPLAKTAVLVSMGDAPADWMLAFSMNINSMSLTGSNGSVNAVSSTTSMEMMRLMGTMQPLASVSAPQGSYTGASLTIGSATVMYMDPASKTLMQKTIAGPVSTTVNFATPIVVGSTPMTMGFDLDLAASVTSDAGGNLALNPVFHVTSGMQGAGSPLDPTNGGIQEMMGTVASLSSTSFSMTSMQGAQSLSFTTNSATVFDNIPGMGMMVNGMIVAVDANLQTDGSLLATRIRSLMNAGGVMGGGAIVSVSGQPATQLKIVMQKGAGTGMMSSILAGGVVVTMSGSTQYEIDRDNIDMSNLPFTPVFDAAHLFVGQNAMPISSGGMMSGGSGSMMGGSPMGGTMTASEVDLQQQGLSGTAGSTITSGSAGSFKLTLPADSAFSSLTGATFITIYNQPGTNLIGKSSIASGATIHALGLLFLDSGQWKLVASRIGAN